jgi:FtsP/CotA-like multicopper oxidase with cupredoxin domain
MPAYGPPLDYKTGNPTALGGNPDVTPFLKSVSVPAAPNENGWKDTIQCPPGMVTRILVRFAPTTTAAGAAGEYPFDPSNAEGADYVWHCHIVDHEDNEMMRPYTVTPLPGVTRTLIKGTDY